MTNLLKKPNKSAITRTIRLDGMQFGLWKVISQSDERRNDGRIRWVCICECGQEKNVSGFSLKNGTSTNCGCRKSENHVKRLQIYPKGSQPIKEIWRGMINRCYNSNHISYPNYGGKGVTVCEEWRNDFVLFYEWAIANGWQKGLEIDKDFNGNGMAYSPNNCCIVTKRKNSQKRRTSFLVTHNDEIKCLAEWCEIYGIRYALAWVRIKNCGKSLEWCISHPEPTKTGCKKLPD